MKHLMLFIVFTFHAIFASASLAWSPLDLYQDITDSKSHCYSVFAISDDDDEAKKKLLLEAEEEEEEPDCD